jgi:hypothetical protein
MLCNDGGNDWGVKISCYKVLSSGLNLLIIMTMIVTVYLCMSICVCGLPGGLDVAELGHLLLYQQGLV